MAAPEERKRRVPKPTLISKCVNCGLSVENADRHIDEADCEAARNLRKVFEDKAFCLVHKQWHSKTEPCLGCNNQPARK
jgi:hypothetical protein